MSFARLAKFVALLLVALALWQVRSPVHSINVAILAVPSASEDMVRTAADWSAGGAVSSEDSMVSGATFWRLLFAADRIAGRDAGDLMPLWQGRRAVARSAAVPRRLFDTSDDQKAGQAGVAFVGSSAGAVVEAEDFAAGRVPPPYDRAVDAIKAASQDLERGAWSDWIPVSASPGLAESRGAAAGEFQFVRFDEASYFFSPVYFLGENSSRATAFLRGAARELRPTIAAHPLALAQRRLGASRAFFESPGTEARPIVVFDAVAEETAAVFAPDTMPAAVAVGVRDSVVAQINALRAAVGADGVVVVFGGPSTTRDAGYPAWYRVLAGSDLLAGEKMGETPLDFDAARSLVLYALGVSLGSEEKALLSNEFTGRFPIRAVFARSSVPRLAEPAAQEWSAATLDSVPGALGRGH